MGLGIVVLLVASIPVLWLIYLIGLHTYLIIAKRTTIELIMESRRKNRIHPTNNLNLKKETPPEKDL